MAILFVLPVSFRSWKLPMKYMMTTAKKHTAPRADVMKVRPSKPRTRNRIPTVLQRMVIAAKNFLLRLAPAEDMDLEELTICIHLRVREQGAAAWKAREIKYVGEAGGARDSRQGESVSV